MRSARYKYQGLFFMGLALIIVLLPFPNVFGILLDAAVLALGYPIIGSRLSLILIFVYNFNPLKLNGALVLFYFIFGIIKAKVGVLPLLNSDLAAAILSGITIVLITLAEFLIIRSASAKIWKILSNYDPRMRDLMRP